MEEETPKTFVGRDAWLLIPDPDLLLWWEGEHIRIESLKSMEIADREGWPLTPIYFSPESVAWSQAAQMADEED